MCMCVRMYMFVCLSVWQRPRNRRNERRDRECRRKKYHLNINFYQGTSSWELVLRTTWGPWFLTLSESIRLHFQMRPLCGTGVKHRPINDPYAFKNLRMPTEWGPKHYKRKTHTPVWGLNSPSKLQQPYWTSPQHHTGDFGSRSVECVMANGFYRM